MLVYRLVREQRDRVIAERLHPIFRQLADDRAQHALRLVITQLHGAHSLSMTECSVAQAMRTSAG